MNKLYVGFPITYCFDKWWSLLRVLLERHKNWLSIYWKSILDFFSLSTILRIWMTCRTLPLMLYTLISYGIISNMHETKNATWHIIAWNIVFVNFYMPLILLSWEGFDLRLIMIIHYSANSCPCLYYLVQIHTESTN